MNTGDQKAKQANLEERRLQLEEFRFEAERETRAADQAAKKAEEDAQGRQATFDRRYKLLELKERRADRELKRQELQAAEGRGIRFTSSQAAVAGALLALLSAAVGGVLQAWVTRDVEAGKIQVQLKTEDLRARASIDLEREKEQHELILKMISVGDVRQAKTNLEFLAEAGLVSDKELADRILKAKATPVLPTPTVYNNPGGRLRCDTGRPVASKIGIVQIGDGELYIESCVVFVADGPSGYYGYVYRIQNKGSKSLNEIYWKAAAISISSLNPDEVFTSTHVASVPPRVQLTEIYAGANSKATFEAMLPSE